MTKLVLALCLLASPMAMAFPSADEMKQNFDTCNSTNEYWYRRFGQYVVAFDRNTAYNKCSRTDEQPRLAACRVDGHWIYAGYYCETRGNDSY